jgi:D-methionine transport system permease protein
MLRSIPFIILILAIIPITMALMGTFLGWEGAIPALVISATPFYAQIVFNSVTQVSPDIVETAKAMGASPLRIVWIVIHEALSPLIRGITITFISLIGLIAITGVVGAGGIGQYCQNATKTLGEDDDWLWLGVATILVIILVVQVVGEIFARKLDHH